MPPSAAKLSVSVPLELAKAVRRRVGARGLSGYVVRALRHEMEREQLLGFITELEETQGPISKTTLVKARNAWPKRSF